MDNAPALKLSRHMNDDGNNKVRVGYNTGLGKVQYWLR
jgi:hypothetical protein